MTVLAVLIYYKISNELWYNSSDATSLNQNHHYSKFKIQLIVQVYGEQTMIKKVTFNCNTNTIHIFSAQVEIL